MTTVTLIGVTVPRIEGISTAEELVAYAARVSNPTNQLNTETAPKLLKYLVKNKHWSPFEMVHIIMEINTTRDIAHQIVRHRSFSFQEFSQRYAKPTDLGYTYRDARLQDEKNRQNSIKINDPLLQAHWQEKQDLVLDTAQEAYRWALNAGIAKEQARAVLPEGLTNTRLYMSGSLRSWIHYIQLRSANGTQEEHREVALQATKVLNQEFPSITDILYAIE